MLHDRHGERHRLLAPCGQEGLHRREVATDRRGTGLGPALHCACHDAPHVGVHHGDGLPVREARHGAYGSITYAGLLALLYAEVPRDDPRVVSAVDFAARHWTLDENPGMGDQGLYFYYNVIARALTAGGMDAIARKDGAGGPIRWREELACKLTATQRPDGSWANVNNRFWENDPVLATAYALLALRHAQGGNAD